MIVMIDKGGDGRVLRKFTIVRYEIFQCRTVKILNGYSGNWWLVVLVLVVGDYDGGGI